MKTRQVKKIKQEAVLTDFEEVEVKDEIEDDSYLDDTAAAQSGDANKSNDKASKKKSSQEKSRTATSWSRAVQVCSEDIDASEVQATWDDDEDEPTNHSACEQSTTHCRFCLRRVAPEHLKLIDSKQKAKAWITFRARILPGDPFLSACRNCLNMLDIFTDFKDSVNKSKKLLSKRQGYMESDGWGQGDTFAAFDKCKAAVVEHRKQLYSMYDKHVRRTENKKTEVDWTISDTKLECKAEPTESMPSNQTDDITKSEIGPDLAEFVSTSLRTEVSTADHQNSLQDTATKWNESDDDFVPDGMDGDDEDYVPEDETPQPTKVCKPETDDKETKEVKPKIKKSKKGAHSPAKLCDICGERICSTGEESHMNQHLGIKPYTCPEKGCGLTFHSRYNQSKHMRRFHQGAETNECDICGKIIRGKLWALKQHQRIHNVTDKNFVCKVCGKGFAMKTYLTQHAMTHSSDMPHKCTHCGKRFNNKWSLRTHVKSTHKKQKDVIEETYDSQNAMFDSSVQ